MQQKKRALYTANPLSDSNKTDWTFGSLVFLPYEASKKKLIEKYMLTFLGPDSRFQIWEFDLREEISRRIRIWDQKMPIFVSRGQKIGKTNLRKFLIRFFFSSLVFFYPFIGLKKITETQDRQGRSEACALRPDRVPETQPCHGARPWFSYMFLLATG